MATMIIEMMRRGIVLLMIGLFMGALGACDEQGSTEQVREAVSKDARNANQATPKPGKIAPEPEAAN